jgi:hypothetical protein
LPIGVRKLTPFLGKNAPLERFFNPWTPGTTTPAVLIGLQNQHGVAVAEETVVLRYRVSV